MDTQSTLDSSVVIMKTEGILMIRKRGRILILRDAIVGTSTISIRTMENSSERGLIKTYLVHDGLHQEVPTECTRKGGAAGRFSVI